MSTPANPEAQVSTASPAEATEPTFAQQVNDVVKQLKQDDKGVWLKPEDSKASEEVLYAATLEARRRNAESALGKTKHELQTETGIRKKLEQRVTQQVQASLTPEQAEELDTLKFEDPDKWRTQLDKYEREARNAIQEELNADTQAVSQEVALQQREEQLQRYNDTHPDAQINDEVLANDIPPRLSKKLENGEVTFTEFLTLASDYLTAPKVVKTNTPESMPNLGSAGGGSTPTDDALEGQEVDEYKNTVF